MRLPGTARFRSEIQAIFQPLTDPYNQVINLTKKHFTKNEFKLLGKNLNFCPTPKQYNRNQLNKDLLQFYRNIKLKAHFKNNETNNEFRVKTSSWTPSSTHPNVLTFIDAVNKDIENTKPGKQPKDNISNSERIALRNLKMRKDIVITKADKGGAVVIWDTTDYLKEAYSQLDDKKTYSKLDEDPTDRNTKIVIDTIQKLKSEKKITDRLALQLTPEKTVTPNFYMLPKIHKSGNPGRPVINSCNCHTTNISAFVANSLQPEVEKLRSYVKDTTDLINKVEGTDVPQGSYLVSLDVKALYTNIPHEEGLEAVENTLKGTYRSDFIQAILSLLTLILTLNNFTFNDDNYLQISGCAMGTICAPPYANIFMGKFEEKYLYPLLHSKGRLYLRYIDDIFLIWTGTKNEFDQLMTIINNLHETIKFEYEISETEIPFLDTIIYVDVERKLRTKPYQKPTDRQNFLHRQSAHPEALKKSIPYSQALRGRRICSDMKDFDDFCNKMQGAFIKRGYNTEEVGPQLQKAAKVERTVALTNNKKESKYRATLITTFNRTMPDIKSVLTKHWHLLQLDPALKEMFEQPPMMAFRRNRNIGDILNSKRFHNNEVSRKDLQHQVRSCKPCTLDRKYKCCKQLKETKSFKSNATGKTYDIYHETNCNSKYVIYLLECTKCKIQYVGKSETELKYRIANHRSDAKKTNCILADKHFQVNGHNFDKDASFTIIEQLMHLSTKDNNRKRLEEMEDRWMLRLKTLDANGKDGLNIELDHPTKATGILWT